LDQVSLQSVRLRLSQSWEWPGLIGVQGQRAFWVIWVDWRMA